MHIFLSAVVARNFHIKDFRNYIFGNQGPEFLRGGGEIDGNGGPIG
jgi:hypothetical protein